MNNHDLAIKLSVALWGPWYCDNEGISALTRKIESVLDEVPWEEHQP